MERTLVVWPLPVQPALGARGLPPENDGQAEVKLVPLGTARTPACLFPALDPLADRGLGMLYTCGHFLFVVPKTERAGCA